MSFTPFNAPIQQRPIKVETVDRRDIVVSEGLLKNIGEAFEGEESLIGRLGSLAKTGMFLLLDSFYLEGLLCCSYTLSTARGATMNGSFGLLEVWCWKTI